MDVKGNYPLSKELVERVLDELGLNHGRVSGDYIQLHFEREEDVGSELYFRLDVHGDDKDILVVLGTVRPVISADNYVNALRACNVFNTMYPFGRAYLNEDEAKLCFVSQLLFHNGTTKKFLRGHILEAFGNARAFFTLIHRELHLY